MQQDRGGRAGTVIKPEHDPEPKSKISQMRDSSLNFGSPTQPTSATATVDWLGSNAAKSPQSCQHY